MLFPLLPPVIPMSVVAASPGPFTTHPIIDNVIDAGLEVKIENDILGFIKKSDLSREKEEQKFQTRM